MSGGAAEGEVDAGSNTATPIASRTPVSSVGLDATRIRELGVSPFGRIMSLSNRNKWD